EVGNQHRKALQTPAQRRQLHHEDVNLNLRARLFALTVGERGMTRPGPGMPPGSPWLFARYRHFLPSSSRPAFARSSGVIAGWNEQAALNSRNQGSAYFGISDESFRLTIMIAPRWPSYSVK